VNVVCVSECVFIYKQDILVSIVPCHVASAGDNKTSEKYCCVCVLWINYRLVYKFSNVGYEHTYMLSLVVEYDSCKIQLVRPGLPLGFTEMFYI